MLYYNLCVLPNSFISDTTTVYTKTCLIGTQILGELEYENCTLGSGEYAVCIEHREVIILNFNDICGMEGWLDLDPESTSIQHK